MKTRKTAGSSMQVALSTICNPETDIITGSNIKDGVLDESHSAGWNMKRFGRIFVPKTRTKTFLRDADHLSFEKSGVDYSIEVFANSST